MKQVMLYNPNEKLSPYKYYGAKTKEGSRAFVTCETYMSRYSLRALVQLTLGNGYSYGKGSRINPTLNEFIGKLLDDGLTVYVFDTAKELFAWLIED
jgi:hypothetical protein